jgi:hypothetical protein
MWLEHRQLREDARGQNWRDERGCDLQGPLSQVTVGLRVSFKGNEESLDHLKQKTIISFYMFFFHVFY